MTSTIPALRLASFVAAAMLAVAPAAADGIDPGKLVRFSDIAGVTHEDWVSTDPIITAVVKKIEAGRVSYVTVTTTATGTYSSDGIASPNVLYPGVNTAKPQQSFSFSSWGNGSWTSFGTYRGNSYVSVATYKRLPSRAGTRGCTASASFLYC